MTTELDAVKRGYVLVEMNERGHFFSEGNYDILGAPLTDADDQFTWMAAQPWTNGKIGLIGCSSTAEWQMAATSLGNKALTTIIPESFGAGVGDQPLQRSRISVSHPGHLASISVNTPPS